MRRVLILFGALLAVSVAAFSDQPSFGPHDPGAARQNLSNVDAATGRTVLGLGTMATEAKTDYVATDTFTGHTGATGAAVHGLGTMSTATATDYAKLDTAASFSARVDFGAAEATNFTATPTIAGIDVFGSISAALDEIIGAP